MTRRQKRSAAIAAGLVILGVAVALVLAALEDTIVFFYGPTEVAEKAIKPGERFRLGGLVADGSVVRSQGKAVRFVVTDTNRTVPVRYIGILPDLFREGQGVVAEGWLNVSGTFEADSVLAKHDETYMPPEVAAMLKKQGQWKGQGR